MTVSDEVITYLAKVGFDDTYGARPLKRAIQSNVEDTIVEALLDQKIKENA